MAIHQLSDIDPFSVRVSVYKNLRNGMWSIKTAERVGDIPKGRVIAHADECVPGRLQLRREPAHARGDRGRNG